MPSGGATGTGKRCQDAGSSSARRPRSPGRRGVHRTGRIRRHPRAHRRRTDRGVRARQLPSCIYTTADNGVTEVEQVRGTKIAMTDVGSTSGHLGPSQMLVDAGLNPGADIEVLTIGDAVHAELQRGDVAAVGVGCHDYEEFLADEADPERFPLLEEGPVLPPDLLMARAGLDEQTIDTIRDTFTGHYDE